MEYTSLTIDSALAGEPRARVMIIYTGGTIGMARNSFGVLMPFNFSHILEHLPTLRNLQLQLVVTSFVNPIDSSDIEPRHWQAIGEIIEKHYSTQNGFVVLHGTDTMAYTASAVAFMLQNLSKPVVFTGAQLPISELRSDARENLITALEVASTIREGVARVPEVCVCFGGTLIRGCRAKKVESMHFDAFQSENYPLLATAGVAIKYDDRAIQLAGTAKLHVLKRFDTGVAILKLYPGITAEIVAPVVRNPGIKALILESYGSGNAPTAAWFVGMLGEAIQAGLLVLNISQCPGGMVVQGKYETSRGLKEVGVISGSDMTVEAAVTKLMLLIGEYGVEAAKLRISSSMAGEMSARSS